MNKAVENRFDNGIRLEHALTHFLTQKMRLGKKVDHNNFNPKKYSQDNHNIVDIVIKDKVLLECTNPKDTTYMNDNIMNEKIDYFIRKDSEHKFLWVLVVSFYCFSKAILQRIKVLGIQLIVLNITATKYNFHKIINALFNSKLYSLLRSFLEDHKIIKTKTVAQMPLNNHIYHLEDNTQSYSNRVATLNNIYQHERLFQKLQEEQFLDKINSTTSSLNLEKG